MGDWDRFFAFFNGMVTGTSPSTQDGHKYLSCSPSKSSRSDSKLKAKPTPSTMAYWTASTKS